MTNPNDNVFPWDDVGPHPGLTKREYIATAIYQGMSAIQDSIENRIRSAKFAVECADALIIELSYEKDRKTSE